MHPCTLDDSEPASKSVKLLLSCLQLFTRLVYSFDECPLEAVNSSSKGCVTGALCLCLTNEPLVQTLNPGQFTSELVGALSKCILQICGLVAQLSEAAPNFLLLPSRDELLDRLVLSLTDRRFVNQLSVEIQNLGSPGLVSVNDLLLDRANAVWQRDVLLVAGGNGIEARDMLAKYCALLRMSILQYFQVLAVPVRSVREQCLHVVQAILDAAVLRAEVPAAVRQLLTFFFAIPTRLECASRSQ